MADMQGGSRLAIASIVAEARENRSCATALGGKNEGFSANPSRYKSEVWQETSVESNQQIIRGSPLQLTLRPMRKNRLEDRMLIDSWTL